MTLQDGAAVDEASTVAYPHGEAREFVLLIELRLIGLLRSESRTRPLRFMFIPVLHVLNGRGSPGGTYLPLWLPVAVAPMPLEARSRHPTPRIYGRTILGARPHFNAQRIIRI